MRISLAAPLIAGVLALSAALSPAFGQARTDVNIGLVLEPPNLDPTAGAAAAIDEVVTGNWLPSGYVTIGLTAGGFVDGAADGEAWAEEKAG